MAIPSYQEFMLPLLKFAGGAESRTSREAYEAMAEQFGLSEEECQELLPSGTQPVLNNRVGWALSYMRQAGLIESPKRGVFRITTTGRELLAQNPLKVDVQTLERYPAFLEFKSRSRSNGSAQTAVGAKQAVEDDRTPEEELEDAWRRHRAAIEADLLEQVLSVSPGFFERLVLDVLVAMGYGGNRAEAARAVGRSGDGGIDGTINEDPLGLDVIYLQAKRWEGVVGRPEIQKFAGALQGRRARKGVFITTSTFSKDAVEYVGLIESRIILIDGRMLARLMVEHGVGVSHAGAYPVKKIDSDYFSES